MSALLLLGLILVLVLVLLRSRKRRDGEPPLIKGWVPFLGKAVAFGRDAHRFLEALRKRHGDVFTVRIAGRYMTFIMDPLLYPSIARHGRQLDFHEFSDKVAPDTFGYPPVLGGKFPGMQEQIQRCYRLLQGDGLSALTESMAGNLLLVLRQDHLGEEGGGWRSGGLYDFCNAVMFEATLLTVFGRPASGGRHADTGRLREAFGRFDSVFPLLIAQVPIGLLGGARAARDQLIDYFLPHKVASWCDASPFIRTRSELLDRYEALKDVDKAAHHLTILWASVGNTVPASFWALYFLLRDPEGLQVVLQELRAVLGPGGRGVRLDREQLGQLVHLGSAVSESLRLSSASMNIRVAREDFCLRLGGERTAAVRRGDVIALYPQSMHLDPDIYEEPQSFRVDRFLGAGLEEPCFFKGGRRLQPALMPFGSGSSRCPGRHFALNEIKQFLSLVLLHMELQLEEGGATPDPGRAGLGILLPAADVRFRYRPRSGA